MFRLVTLAVIVLGFVAAGCDSEKSDSKDSPKGEEKAGEKTGGDEEKTDAPELTLKDHTWTLGEFTVNGKRPAGWTEMALGDGFIYRADDSFRAPTFWISATCEGACGAAVAENIMGAAAAQAEAHKSSFETVEILEDGAADGGHVFRMKLVPKSGEEAGMIGRFFHQEGWETTVKCTYQANDTQWSTHLDAMLEVCNSLEVTPLAVE